MNQPGAASSLPPPEPRILPPLRQLLDSNIDLDDTTLTPLNLTPNNEPVYTTPNSSEQPSQFREPSVLRAKRLPDVSPLRHRGIPAPAAPRPIVPSMPSQQQQELRQQQPPQQPHEPQTPQATQALQQQGHGTEILPIKCDNCHGKREGNCNRQYPCCYRCQRKQLGMVVRLPFMYLVIGLYVSTLPDTLDRLQLHEKTQIPLQPV